MPKLLIKNINRYQIDDFLLIFELMIVHTLVSVDSTLLKHFFNLRFRDSLTLPQEDLVQSLWADVVVVVSVQIVEGHRYVLFIYLCKVKRACQELWVLNFTCPGEIGISDVPFGIGAHAIIAVMVLIGVHLLSKHILV